MSENNDMMQLYFKYGLALKELDNIFVNLYQKYSESTTDNPIEHLKYRIKTEDSIQGKLNKLKNKYPTDDPSKYEFTAKNIENNLDDIVGYRVICPFFSDVYQVIEEIRKFPGIKITEERNYIDNPKESGYSSYHFKVEVPVQLPDSKLETVKAEIQVRTSTMDLAALEHKISYKKNINFPPQIKEKIAKMYEYCNIIDKSLNIVLQEQQEKLGKRKPQKSIEKTQLLSSFVKSEEFQKITAKEQEALRIMDERIKQISAYFLETTNNNPIEHVKCRIKSEISIIDKLKRLNQDLTYPNVENNINDIAGIRIVCPFSDNVEQVIEELRHFEDLEILEEQDYREKPKENGYSSYHMLVSVPVMLNGIMTKAKVELQIRTMIQEVWATLEERLCYRNKAYYKDEKLVTELRALSSVLADLDNNMNEIYKYSIQQQKESQKKKVLSKAN